MAKSKGKVPYPKKPQSPMTPQDKDQRKPGVKKGKK